MAEKQTKLLSSVSAVTSMLHSDTLLIKTGGNIRQISLANFMESMNRDETELLHEVAWAVPIKDESQSSSDYGPLVGNLEALATYKALTGRYLMKPDGTSAKLNKLSSTIYADGTPLDESKGSVVTIAPRLYFLYRTEETGEKLLWLSMYPISKHFLGNANGGEYMVIGSYLSSIASGKLVSRAGVDFDTSSKTINAYWNAAQSFGPNWGLWDYDCWRWVVFMTWCECAGNVNSQSVLGYGVGGTSIPWATTLASSTLRKTGMTRSLGDASGIVDISDDPDANAASCHVSILGVEDVWNLQWQFVQGVYFGSSGNTAQDGTELFIYKGNRLPSSAELAAAEPLGEYRKLTRVTTNGYVRTLIKGENFDIFPSALGGDSVTNYGDLHYANTTGQVLLVGGISADGAGAGAVCANSGNAWSLTLSSVGARPAYYGPVTIIDGRNM